MPRVIMKTIDVNRRVARPKRFFQQRIRGDDLTLVISRQQEKRDADAPEDVAGDHLEESEVAGVGEAGNADEGQRTGLGGDDREQHRPPRDLSSRDEVVLRS
jgi:hypothetical protein